jgi:hypothetical protein
MSSVQTAIGPGTALPTFLPWSSNIKPPIHPPTQSSHLSKPAPINPVLVHNTPVFFHLQLNKFTTFIIP